MHPNWHIHMSMELDENGTMVPKASRAVSLCLSIPIHASCATETYIILLEPVQP